MLNEKVSQLLNDQVNKEFYSAYLYLQFSNFYVEQGLAGFANWYKVQAQEERDHAMLFYQYLHNNNASVTLEAIAKGGIEEFYTGELAQKMVDGLQANGSLMALEDLATYTVAEREPIRTEYYGYEVVTVPPPSNGGDWLLEMLNIMEEKDISQYDPSTLEYQYIFNEACRIGLVDSYTYIGDPAFYDLPVEEMISDEFAAERAALIDMDNMQAMESVPLSDRVAPGDWRAGAHRGGEPAYYPHRRHRPVRQHRLHHQYPGQRLGLQIYGPRSGLLLQQPHRQPGP